MCRRGAYDSKTWRNHARGKVEVVTTRYLSEELYRTLIDHRASQRGAPICIWSGSVDRDAIKIDLGERHDVWPASIRPALDHEAERRLEGQSVDGVRL